MRNNLDCVIAHSEFPENPNKLQSEDVIVFFQMYNLCLKVPLINGNILWHAEQGNQAFITGKIL